MHMALDSWCAEYFRNSALLRRSWEEKTFLVTDIFFSGAVSSLPQTTSGEHSFFGGRGIGEVRKVAFGDTAELGADYV
jgi:hypothetical protein